MEQFDSAAKVTPYSALAEYYDQIMEHVNYRQWANYIKILFRYAHRSVRQVADLSCGTGNLLRYMHGFRRKTYGFDLSLPMLKVARKKLLKPRLACADFLSLPLKPLSLDAALVLYDSINYLQTPEEINRFLQEAYAALRIGGILIFDAVTVYLCQTAFRHYEEQSMTDEKNRYHRTSFFLEEEKIQVNRFKIWIDGKQYFEEHRQKIFEIEEWVQMIKNSDFKLMHIFSNFSLNPVHDHSERAHFILLKKK